MFAKFKTKNKYFFMFPYSCSKSVHADDQTEFVTHYTHEHAYSVST